MSIFGKIMDSVKFSPEDNDDDYFIDDGYEDDDDYDDADDGKRGGLFGRRTSEEKPQTERKSGGFLGRKVVPIREARDGGMEVTMIKPTTLEDSRDICEIGRAHV